MTDSLSYDAQQTSAASSASTSGTDNNKSRKREREISLEPTVNPEAEAAIDTEARTRMSKDPEIPVKKNKVLTDPGEGADSTTRRSRSPSISPPARGSPPPEMKMKVRQISQGVEDLTWRNMDTSVKANVCSQEDARCDVGKGTSSPLTETTAGSNPVNDIEALEVESDGNEKGLKRKFAERGTSQGPTGPEEAKASSDTLKRPRDEADGDENPHQCKRPTPPPDGQEISSPSTSSLKETLEPAMDVAVASSLTQGTESSNVTGFMAYASSNSPFSIVKGPNLFASAKSPSPTPTSDTIQSNSSSTPGTGFEAFASHTSPFSAAAQSKSSVFQSSSSSKWSSGPISAQRNSTKNINSGAFSVYATGGAHGFVPLPKRARAGSPGGSTSLESNSTVGLSDNKFVNEDDDREPERSTSFGERLRSSKNDESPSEEDGVRPKVMLKEQEVMTGEEGEETLHQVRGKLYSLVDGTTWKEKGTGLLKLNVRESDGMGARLVMRKEAVYAVILNVTLFRGMRCELAQDPRYLRFSVIENGVTIHYNLKLANAKIAADLREEILANLPA